MRWAWSLSAPHPRPKWRLASYPGTLWMLMIGVIAMFGALAWQGFRSGAWAA